MTMDKLEIGAFKNDFRDAMKDLEAKYGVVISMGNIRYTNSTLEAKIEAANVDPNGNPSVNPCHEKNAQWAFISHNLDFDGKPIIGHKFKLISGDVVTIRDFDSKKHSYPVLYDRDGRHYKCSVDQIAMRIAD